LIFPGATMFVTLMCLNFLGDGLRDALDPKER
jgi:oligopeptide transport system permease protein